MASSVPALLVPALHLAVRDAVPNVTLYVVDAATPALYEWLAEGRIDLVMLFNLAESAELEVVPLFYESFFLVGAAGTGGGAREVNFDDIFGLPVATSSASSTWRKALDEAAENLGKQLNIVLETESASALMALATAGNCYTIMPGSYLQSDVCAGRVDARRIVNPDLGGIMSVVNLVSRPLNDTQLKVRSILVDVARKTFEPLNSAVASGTLAPIRRATPSSLFPTQSVRRRLPTA